MEMYRAASPEEPVTSWKAVQKRIAVSGELLSGGEGKGKVKRYRPEGTYGRESI